MQRATMHLTRHACRWDSCASVIVVVTFTVVVVVLVVVAVVVVVVGVAVVVVVVVKVLVVFLVVLLSLGIGRGMCRHVYVKKKSAAGAEPGLLLGRGREEPCLTFVNKRRAPELACLFPRAPISNLGDFWPSVYWHQTYPFCWSSISLFISFERFFVFSF